MPFTNICVYYLTDIQYNRIEYNSHQFIFILFYFIASFQEFLTKMGEKKFFDIRNVTICDEFLVKMPKVFE